MTSQTPDPDKTDKAQVWGRDGEGPHAFVAPTVSPGDIVVGQSAVYELDDVDADADTDEDMAGAPGEAEGELARSEVEAEDTELLTAPASSSVPGPNDLAIGYMIPLVLYFVAYSVNWFCGGYCLESNKMNAFGAIFYFWTPALCASCMLLGGRALKVNGAILFVPLAAGAIFGGQYFHVYERFLNDVGPYGPLVKSRVENGWQICNYEAVWIAGEQPGSTYTRERQVGFGIRLVRKMQIGEPP